MSNPPHRRPIPTGPSPSTSSSSSSGANNASSNSAFSTSRPAGSTPSAAAAAAAKGKAPAPMGGARVVVPGAGGGGAQGVGQAGGGGGAALVQRKTLNSILVSTRQKGNPIIQHIRTVPWEYGDIKCDYQVGATAGLLYLSIRYHLLHPEYIHTRIAELGQSYSLRIVLVHCDADNHAAAVRELTKICLINGYTMIVSWSAEESARYLTLYKSLERRPPDLIRERVDDSYMAHLTAALTSVRGVNKTDCTTLVSNFGSFSKILLAPPSSLSALPGLGDKKVKRLRDAFSSPFQLGSAGEKKRKREEKEERERRTGEARRRGEGGERELN